MAATSQGVAARLGQFVDWFIPPHIAACKEQRSLARLFLISHLLGPFLGNTVPLSLYMLSPSPGYDIAVLAVSITGFWVFPIALKLNVRYDLLAIISIQNLIFCILWSCYFNGGVTSPTLPWVLTIPLLAFFYIGSSVPLRNIVLIVFTLNIIGFGALYAIYPPPSNGISLTEIQLLGLISTCAASLYVIMMAVYYARALASQAEIEVEVRRHLETARDLQRAAIEAGRASTAKSEFLAKMSHELRTPLNAVIGYSQMLLEEAADRGDDENTADFQKILTSGQHLLRLVNNVLDLSKLEAGHAEFFNEPFAVRSLVEGVVKSLEPIAVANGNEVSIRLAGGVDVMVGDLVKVQCILQNVIENAVKFTKDGHVEVVGHREQGAEGETMVFEVIDDGPGIDDNDLGHLFEQFSVGDDLTSAKYGGTGIGLALSNKLCHLMGGSVAVATEVGVGSRFTIRLPVSRAMPIERGHHGENVERAERRGGKSAPAAEDDDSSTMAVAANG